MLYDNLAGTIMESALSYRDRVSLLHAINDKLTEIEERDFTESVISNKLEIYEKYYASDIDESEKDGLLALVEEKVLQRPMKSLLEKLEDIRDGKPDTIYDEDVKKWVDAHYDELSKASDVIAKHKEKDDITKADIAILLPAIAALCVSPFLVVSSGIVGAIGFIGTIISSIAIIADCIIINIRNKDYTDSADALVSMKGYLSSIDTKNLSEEQKKKVKSLIGKVEDIDSKRKVDLKNKQISATLAVANAVASRK